MGVREGRDRLDVSYCCAGASCAASISLYTSHQYWSPYQNRVPFVGFLCERREQEGGKKGNIGEL